MTLTALLVIARTVQIVASILLAGIFAFEVVMLGPVRRARSDDLNELERQFFQLALWSLLAALLSALLWFWLEVADMSGLSLTNAFSTTAWRTVLFETEFGRVWQLRFGLIAVEFALIATGLARDEVLRAPILVLWLFSVVLLVSLAWISHAAAARVQPLGLLGDALHLCAAGTWIGGLAPMAMFLRRVPASLTLGECAAPVLNRFSALSLSCVSVLAVSGFSNSWLLVGSIHALFTSRYGWLLLFKLALFGTLIGFGACNRFVVKTKLLNVPANSDLLSQLRRNVICEACLGLAVVIIVACLGVTPPSQHP
ncbi:MAG TPA: CopD family protein [Chthoniobacterales bacterium]|jgi:putative copper resistance protein D|nr:CopD family protein [Chthoniobacterales bacterium]